MAEKGTPIEDGASGDVIATRDAFETDESANSRVIQRFDLASGRGPSPLGTATRGSAGVLNTIDALDLSNLPLDLTSNLLDVGDKSVVVIQAEFSGSGAQPVTVTPIMFDAEATPGVLGVLESKTLVQPYAFHNNGLYVTQAAFWDTLGAHKIGLHVTSWADSGGSITLKVYGWVI